MGCLLLLPALGFATDLPEFDINDLSGGMYSYPSANEIPDKSASYIQNFFTDVQPLVSERTGSTRRDSTVLGNPNAVTGLWTFLDTSGNEWIISFSSRTFYKNTVGNAPVAFGPKTTVAQIPNAAITLGKIWFVDGTDSMWSFDGVSTAAIAGAPLGTFISPWRTRLVIGNIGGSQSTLRFSADGDGTNWTIGGNATDPFAQSIGSANDGYPITCLYWSYLDTLIVGRKYDLWGITGFDQPTEETRRISSEIGCIQNGSMREFDGSLMFLSARGLEEMRGADIKFVSEPVRDLTDAVVKNTVNALSNNQHLTSDWAAGTVDPAGSLSTTVLPNSIALSTIATESFLDDLNADFSSGTFNNTQALGQVLELAYNPTTQSQAGASNTAHFGCGNSPAYQAQSFTPASSVFVSSLTVDLSRTAAVPNDTTINIYNDSSNSPGSSLANGSISGSALSTFEQDIVINLNTTLTLTSGSRYWIVLNDSPGCSGGGKDINWWRTSGSFSESYRVNGSNDTTNNTKYKVFENKFATSGTFVSRSFDTTVSSLSYLWNWGTAVRNDTAFGQTLTYQTQSSSDNVNFSSLVAFTTNPISPVNRYLRYKATFGTTDTSVSPFLDSLSLSAGPFIRSSGTFTSQLLSIGNAITSWGPITIVDNPTSSGTITYQFGSTSTAVIGNISNYTFITNGQTPTVSTNPYAAFKIVLKATAANDPVPQINTSQFLTTWFEGSAPPLVSWIWDRRYWLSLTTNTASGQSLDSVLVYQRNRTFTLLKGINAASFTRWRDNLYWGDSTGSTGLVYKYDITNNDDSSNIISKLVTKSYDLGASNRDKDVRNCYVTYLGNAGFTGNFSLTYDMDRSGNAYSLGSVNMNDGTGQLDPKFPLGLRSSPTQGREIQYTLIKNGTGDRLKLYDMRTNYILKEPR